jgi:hypothetical protein
MATLLFNFRRSLAIVGNSGNPTHPLPPGFHPISPKVTQYTQGSAEGCSPKMSKPGVKAGCVKSKNQKTTCGPQAPSPATSIQPKQQTKYETTLAQFFYAATKKSATLCLTKGISST